MTKIGGGAKDEETHTGRMRDEFDKASADFGHNPGGWREFCSKAASRSLILFDITVVALLALKQNRASDAWVSS